MAKKVSKRREWTPAQVRTLKSLARQKKHAAKIAKALKRTEGATRQKAFTLGLSLDSAGLSSRCPPMRLSKRAPPTAGLFYFYEKPK